MPLRIVVQSHTPERVSLAAGSRWIGNHFWPVCVPRGDLAAAAVPVSRRPVAVSAACSVTGPGPGSPAGAPRSLGHLRPARAVRGRCRTRRDAC